MLLDRDSQSGMNFFDELLKSPATLRSGRAIRRKILALQDLSGVEWKMLHNKVHSESQGKVYFKLGMKKPDVEAAALALERDMLRLNPATQEFVKVQTLLAKFPNELNEEKKHLEIEITNAAARGGAAPFTYDQLAKTLMAHLSGRSGPGYSLETNFTDADRRQVTCWNCGGKGHGFAECASKCGTCGLGFCGGAKLVNPKCMTVYGMGKDPVDATGHPLPDYVKQKITKRAKDMEADGSLQQKIRRGKVGREVNTVEDNQNASPESNLTNLMDDMSYGFAFD